MKKLATLILVLATALQLSAMTFYDQLCAFNPNWKKYNLPQLQTEAKNFHSDADYVYVHLTTVIPMLKSNPIQHLNREQVQTRNKLIAYLDSYRKARNFPINYYRSERIPVFIDEHGTHCAVGFLMQQSGYESLARRTSETDNYIWVKDITDPQALKWQQWSGFTLEELKIVQGAYDSYIEGAMFLPNKYEIPQKPQCIVAYFESTSSRQKLPKTKENIWCYGEGSNGVLNGRWEQNYGLGIPWIVGFYENGKRTGKWEEYYQGTKLLCRTENWFNDKLNGIRKRFDRSGKIIEEILFRNGNAVTKTNYDFKDSLIWIRKPLPDNRMKTEVYNFGGALIATGEESVYNPGNLQWFQNIELTALNTIAVSAQQNQSSSSLFGINNESKYRGFRSGATLFQSPPLVEYKKQGKWIFYREYNTGQTNSQSPQKLSSEVIKHYAHFGVEFNSTLSYFEDMQLFGVYDSLEITFTDNLMTQFLAYSPVEYVNIEVVYQKGENDKSDIVVRSIPIQDKMVVKEIGRYNRFKQKIGTWKHYNTKGELYKLEQFILPKNEYED